MFCSVYCLCVNVFNFVHYLFLLLCLCILIVAYVGDRGSTVVKVCATNRKVAASIPAGVSGFFNDIKSFRSHYGPGVDSASNRNE